MPRPEESLWIRSVIFGFGACMALRCNPKTIFNWLNYMHLFENGRLNFQQLLISRRGFSAFCWADDCNSWLGGKECRNLSQQNEMRANNRDIGIGLRALGSAWFELVYVDFQFRDF